MGKKINFKAERYKNTYDNKKGFDQKLFRIKFPTKNSVDAYLYLPQERSYGTPNICHFLIYYYVLEWKSRFTLGLNAAKSTDCIEKCFKQKSYKIKFPTKLSVGAYIYPPPSSGARGFQRFVIFFNIMH